VNQVATMAKTRWIIPRAARRPDFREWTREMIPPLLGEPSGALETFAVIGLPEKEEYSVAG
jgi:hypothetical protein